MAPRQRGALTHAPRGRKASPAVVIVAIVRPAPRFSRSLNHRLKRSFPRSRSLSLSLSLSLSRSCSLSRSLSRRRDSIPSSPCSRTRPRVPTPQRRTLRGAFALKKRNARVRRTRRSGIHLRRDWRRPIASVKRQKERRELRLRRAPVWSCCDFRKCRLPKNKRRRPAQRRQRSRSRSGSSRDSSDENSPPASRSQTEEQPRLPNYLPPTTDLPGRWRPPPPALARNSL